MSAKLRNVEIKAKIKQISHFLERVKILSKSEGTLIKQHDIFYNSSHGRLKLRKFEDGSGELIYYDRPDQEGPKLSNYEKVTMSPEEINNLDRVLNSALGTKYVVKKNRYLFMVGQTRVHVDDVEGLGDFMELEVCLRPEQTPEDGEKIAHQLMEDLGVDKQDLIAGAYADLLQSK